MQHWHTHYLGLNTIPPDLSEFEIHYLFNFSCAELDAIRSRYTDHHRLAVAIQIGFLKMTGRPLNTLQSILRPVLQHVGKQLGIEAPSLTSVRALYRRRSTLYEHQAWAKAYLGFVDIGDR